MVESSQIAIMVAIEKCVLGNELPEMTKNFLIKVTVDLFMERRI